MLELFYKIIIFVLRFFIFVGNATADIFIVVFKLIKLLIQYPIKIVLRALLVMLNLFQHLVWILKRVQNDTKRFFSHLFRKRTKQPKKIVKKPQKKIKIKKVKQIVLFPLPFLIKLKYFSWGFLLSFLILFMPIILFLFLQTLPNPQMLTIAPIPQTTKIYDRNHFLLYQIYATQNRTVVPLSSIPVYLEQATVAIEDRNFYTNPGFDTKAILRAFWADITKQQFQGGSTITQQLIKSTLLTPEISISRKIKEIILSFWTEKIYNKNQILEMYLNQVAYGGTSWGVEAASEIYFDKQAKDLDLAQCAFLAGLPRAPSIYSPFSNTPNAWKKRQKDVLSAMQYLGFINKDQLQQALAEKLNFQNAKIPIYAPHFVMYIKDLLIQKYGLPLVEKGGLQVTTTLDFKNQEMAQQVVSNEIAKDENLNLTNGAALITNPQNGDILAMVGGADYNSSISGNVNLATSLRQPGSSIKLVTYTAALSKGFTSATILDDSPITFSYPGSPSYSPVNYDGKFHGRIPLRIAFANSFNIPAVKTLNQIGIPTFLDFAQRMGIDTFIDTQNYGLSLTLGGADTTMLNMATIYDTIANNGNRVNLNPILKITDSSGDALEEKNQVNKIPVVDPGVSFIISNILADNAARSMEFGPNSSLFIPNHTVSVKTGTSDNKRDNWTIGYTKDLAVTVWVGNNDNSPMSPTLASGITGAAPIWNQIMTKLLSKKPDFKPTPPNNIVTKSCFGHLEYFIKGTENSINCNYTPTPSTTPGH